MTCAKMSNLKTKGTELIVWKEEMSILNDLHKKLKILNSCSKKKLTRLTDWK
jgi:hypothetical protein